MTFLSRLCYLLCIMKTYAYKRIFLIIACTEKFTKTLFEKKNKNILNSEMSTIGGSD